MTIKRVDHVSMAVENVETALKLFVDVLGGRIQSTFRVEEDGYQGVTLDIGVEGAQLELLEPIDESGFVARFLKERGEGLHHVTFETSDILAAIAQLESGGVEPFRTRLTDPRWMETFVHPRQGHGVLYQLYEGQHE